jgi:hypothetical protein
MEPPDGCPRQVTALMQRAWQLRAEDRPTFVQMHALMLSVETELQQTGAVVDTCVEQATTTPTNEHRHTGQNGTDVAHSEEDEYDVAIDQ